MGGARLLAELRIMVGSWAERPRMLLFAIMTTVAEATMAAAARRACVVPTAAAMGPAVAWARGIVMKDPRAS